MIVELPDDEAAAAIALTVNAAGGASVKTIVLLTPEQVDEAASRSVNYLPPGADPTGDSTVQLKAVEMRGRRSGIQPAGTATGSGSSFRKRPGA